MKTKVLLVDDIPANLIALRAVLDSPKYEMIEVTSGQDAIDTCSNEEFALIVLDVHMPGLDGFETARRIKAQDKNKDVPIIFVTATFREDPAIKRGFEVGAIDYFGKPFDPNILRAKVGIYTELYLKTKRLEETEQLLKTHAQIKTLLEAMPIGVIIADVKGRIYETNEEARRIWGGIPSVEFSEYDQYKGWWPQTGKQLASSEWAIARSLKDGQTIKEELINIESFDGVRKTVLNSAYPIKSKDGTVLGAVAIVQDITVRQKIAVDLESGARLLLKDLHDLENLGHR
jgi:CheY-like chemotaxis protein